MVAGRGMEKYKTKNVYYTYVVCIFLKVSEDPIGGSIYSSPFIIDFAMAVLVACNAKTAQLFLLLPINNMLPKTVNFKHSKTAKVF